MMILKIILEWAFEWKKIFNPSITKQAQEVIFSHKNTKTDHPTVFFNEAPVANTLSQKHLRLHLDEKLNFNTHIAQKGFHPPPFLKAHTT